MKTTKQFSTVNYVIAILMFLASSALLAEGYNLSGWTSSAHFGFALEESSTTGFEETQGSMFILDLTRPTTKKIDLGIRTTGSGGKKAIGEFYRLSTGPVASFKVWKTWSIQLAWSMFNESALAADGTKAYDSKGSALMLGWERTHALSKTVDLAWGGFISRHQGRVNLVSGINSSTTSNFSSVKTNNGSSRGVEIALKMKL